MNNQPMAVPNRMGGNPAAGYNMIESGVQPVRTIPNPSYPTPRPPGAPQVKIMRFASPHVYFAMVVFFYAFGFALADKVTSVQLV